MEGNGEPKLGPKDSHDGPPTDPEVRRETDEVAEQPNGNQPDVLAKLRSGRRDRDFDVKRGLIPRDDVFAEGEELPSSVESEGRFRLEPHALIQRVEEIITAFEDRRKDLLDASDFHKLDEGLGKLIAGLGDLPIEYQETILNWESRLVGIIQVLYGKPPSRVLFVTLKRFGATMRRRRSVRTSWSASVSSGDVWS